jgi:hypothetical protein
MRELLREDDDDERERDVVVIVVVDFYLRLVSHFDPV